MRRENGSVKRVEATNREKRNKSMLRESSDKRSNRSCVLMHATKVTFTPIVRNPLSCGPASGPHRVDVCG